MSKQWTVRILLNTHVNCVIIVCASSTSWKWKSYNHAHFGIIITSCKQIQNSKARILNMLELDSSSNLWYFYHRDFSKAFLLQECIYIYIYRHCNKEIFTIENHKHFNVCKRQMQLPHHSKTVTRVINLEVRTKSIIIHYQIH